MDLKKKIAMLALSAGLCFGSSKVASALNLEAYFELLPEPINRITMVDPDIPNTKFTIPESLDTKVGETPRYKLPSFILAESLPIFTFNILDEEDPSKEAFGLTLMTTGLIGYSRDPRALEGVEDNWYKLMLELYVEWPKIANMMENSPRAYLVGGFVQEGFYKIDFNNVSNIDKLPSIIESKDNYSSLFTDFYMVVNSDWSKQFIIGRFGFNNIFHPAEKINVHSSLTMEFPSLIEDYEETKIAPYFSGYVEIPTYDFSDIRTLIEAGVKVFGKDDRGAVDAFVLLDHKPKRGSANLAYGIKFKLPDLE